MRTLILITTLLSVTMITKAQSKNEQRIEVTTDVDEKIKFKPGDSSIDLLVDVKDGLDSLVLDMRVEIQLGAIEMFITDPSGKGYRSLELGGRNLANQGAAGVIHNNVKFPLAGRWVINLKLKESRGSFDYKIDYSNE